MKRDIVKGDIVKGDIVKGDIVKGDIVKGDIVMEDNSLKEEAIAVNLATAGGQEKTGNSAVPPLTVVKSEERKREETEETKKMKENFYFFGPATAAYALFYAFCMYQNSSGITFPFFLASSLLYFCFSMKKLGLTLKRNSISYMTAMMLLAVSTFCTDDPKIIVFNKTGIFLLMLSFLLGEFFSTKKWGLGKYFGAMAEILFGALSELARPVQDGLQYLKKHQSKEKRKLYYVLLGLLITIPVLLIVAALLASADAVFRQITDSIAQAVNLENIVSILFQVALWYFAVYAIVANLCRKTVREEVKDHRTGEPILAITITALLTLLYLFFSWIQIVYLFLGRMQLPKGYTYAQYAREGFFQLLAVAVLNLVIVLCCLSFFRESRPLKIVLTLMSLCTFVMIASSGLRMILYIESYNLTFLRIFVLWALAVLSLLFLGVLICIYRDGFPMFRYSVGVVTCFYLILSFSHPDLIIAKVNLENVNGRMDYRYLSGLSADAAPVLIPYLKAHGYEMSVVDIPVTGESLQDEKGYGREAAGDPFWNEVEKHGAEKSKSQTGFGYFYLEKIREDAFSMGIRNFNLSRFLAVREARK